jgi:hypothetical protein
MASPPGSGYTSCNGPRLIEALLLPSTVISPIRTIFLFLFALLGEAAQLCASAAGHISFQIPTPTLSKISQMITQTITG